MFPVAAIDRLLEALHGPTRRYGRLYKRRCVILRQIELSVNQRICSPAVLNKPKLPLAIQAEMALCPNGDAGDKRQAKNE